MLPTVQLTLMPLIRQTVKYKQHRTIVSFVARKTNSEYIRLKLNLRMYLNIFFGHLS